MKKYNYGTLIDAIMSQKVLSMAEDLVPTPRGYNPRNRFYNNRTVMLDGTRHEVKYYLEPGDGYEAINVIDWKIIRPMTAAAV